jgi:hypothetical protein
MVRLQMDATLGDPGYGHRSANESIMQFNNFSETDTVAVSEQSRDDETNVSIMLGTNNGNLKVALIHVVIGGLVVLMAGPTLHPVDWFDKLRMLFVLWVILLVGAVIVRCMLPVLPLKITFARDSVSYDSGRPSTLYLSANVTGPMDFIVRSLTRRHFWTVVRSDLQNPSPIVASEQQEFAVSVRDEHYTMSKLPTELGRQILSAFQAWIKAEPSNAPEHASRAFSSGHSTARAG